MIASRIQERIGSAGEGLDPWQRERWFGPRRKGRHGLLWGQTRGTRPARAETCAGWTVKGRRIEGAWQPLLVERGL